MRDFITVVDAFLAATGRAESTLAGQLFRGASNRIYEIRHVGRGIKTDTLDRAMQWMSDNWPTRSPVRWPVTVERPTRSTAKRRFAAVSVVRPGQKRQRA